MGAWLTTASALSCPHGATIKITPANPRVNVDNAPLATANDLFSIEPCPFTLPTVPPSPSPCVTIQWTVTDLRTRSGAATLSTTSQGMCFSALQAPQGPVSINTTQSVASAT
jgi:hypothetical protein